MMRIFVSFYFSAWSLWQDYDSKMIGKKTQKTPNIEGDFWLKSELCAYVCHTSCLKHRNDDWLYEYIL